jgi:hypothetical protein
MDIQNLGSIGEFVSGIAVIISLVYLTKEIRSSSRATRFDSHMKLRLLTAESQKNLTHPQKAKIFREGLEDSDSLTEDERTSFFSMMYMMVNIADARLVYERTSRDHDAYKAEADPITFFGNTPGFQRWWVNAKRTYNAEMIAHVESRLGSSSSTDT